MTQIRVGIVGCGSIARHRHAPEYAANPHVKLVAFADKGEERAKSLAEKYGADYYADYMDLVARDDIDAISVCTPNYLHAPVTVAAARSGKHVLCEKPMATTVDEAKEMVSAARLAGVKLMIAHNQRLMPVHLKAKEILESGRLGKVLTFRTTFAHGGPERWSAEGPGGWFFQKQQAFVGALGDLGVHKVDLIRWLLDEEIVEVAAMSGTLEKSGADVDDNAVCLLKTENGAMGTMTASWTYKPREDNSTVLYCEKGTMHIGVDPSYGVIVDLQDGQRELYQLTSMQTNEAGGQKTSGIIDSFVGCIVTDTEPEIPGEEGLKSLEVVIAAVKASERKTVVSIA